MFQCSNSPTCLSWVCLLFVRNAKRLLGIKEKGNCVIENVDGNLGVQMLLWI